MAATKCLRVYMVSYKSLYVRYDQMGQLGDVESPYGLLIGRRL